MPDPAETSMTGVVSKTSQWSERFRGEYCELFGAVYPQVVRTVWFVVHDQGLAEEIAQDAFTELYRDWSRLKAYDRPELWARRVAIRRARRVASRRARRVQLEQAAVDQTLRLADDGLRLPDPDRRPLPLAQRHCPRQVRDPANAQPPWRTRFPLTARGSAGLGHWSPVPGPPVWTDSSTTR